MKLILILVISLVYVSANADSEIKNEKHNDNRSNVRNVDIDKRVRDVSRGDRRGAIEHIKHSRGQCKGTERTDGRNHERIRGDWKRLRNDRRPSRFNSKRHRTSTRGQKLQHRPGFREHRGFRRGNQGNCGRCTEGTGKDRRISRRFGASEQQSRGSHWSDRGTRGTSQRVRTVR